MIFRIIAAHIENTEVADLQGISPSVPTGDVAASFAKMMTTFSLLIVLLFAIYILIKYFIRIRLEKGVGRSEIQVLEKKMLTPKTMLYLIEVDKKKILLAESQLEIKKLESFDSEKTTDQDETTS